MRGGVFVQKENQDKNGENEALNRADEIEKTGSVTMESGGGKTFPDGAAESGTPGA